MKLSTAIILSFTILATGCTIQPTKQADRVGSVPRSPGTFYAKWQKGVLEKCSDKAALVTVKEKSKEGMLFTENDVIAIHKYLTEKCSLNSGVVI